MAGIFPEVKLDDECESGNRSAQYFTRQMDDAATIEYPEAWQNNRHDKHSQQVINFFDHIITPGRVAIPAGLSASRYPRPGGRPAAKKECPE